MGGDGRWEGMGGGYGRWGMGGEVRCGEVRWGEVRGSGGR